MGNGHIVKEPKGKSKTAIEKGMKYCIQCGYSFPKSLEFCKTCKAPVCKHCGETFSRKADRCECGYVICKNPGCTHTYSDQTKAHKCMCGWKICQWGKCKISYSQKKHCPRLYKHPGTSRLTRKRKHPGCSGSEKKKRDVKLMKSCQRAAELLAEVVI